MGCPRRQNASLYESARHVNCREELTRFQDWQSETFRRAAQSLARRGLIERCLERRRDRQWGTKFRPATSRASWVRLAPDIKLD
jgi:hypothetical protein